MTASLKESADKHVHEITITVNAAVASRVNRRPYSVQYPRSVVLWTI